MKKKIILSSRNYRLDIPVPIIKGMGWEDDIVDIEPDPERNLVVISNSSRAPVGLTGFQLNIRELRWIRNKKKYRKNLNQNLSEEGRKVLHDTDWADVEDGGYINVKYAWDTIEGIKKTIKNTSDKDLKDVQRALIMNYSNYIKCLVKHLQKKGGKEPSWFSSWFRLVQKKLEV